MDSKLIQTYLRQTEILRYPRRVLATFGATQIEYFLVSPVEDLSNRTRLRQGKVVSLRPKILTTEAFIERFEGFGEEAHGFAQWLSSSYKDLLRSLEYNFKNQGFATRVISEPPEAVADRIATDLDSRQNVDHALIRCPDSAWTLAIMKFALDESARSFPVHVRDLETRGLFDPNKRQHDQRLAEVERLFAAAAGDSAARERLGSKLREYGLFEQFEDRFFSLF